MDAPKMTVPESEIRAVIERIDALKAENAKLRAIATEALDKAEGFCQSMDYLGTGSDSRAAEKEQKADLKEIADLRAALTQTP